MGRYENKESWWDEQTKAVVPQPHCLDSVARGGSMGYEFPTCFFGATDEHERINISLRNMLAYSTVSHDDADEVVEWQNEQGEVLSPVSIRNSFTGMGMISMMEKPYNKHEEERRVFGFRLSEHQNITKRILETKYNLNTKEADTEIRESSLTKKILKTKEETK